MTTLFAVLITSALLTCLINAATMLVIAIVVIWTKRTNGAGKDESMQKILEKLDSLSTK